jgi:hypothetical protein
VNKSRTQQNRLDISNFMKLLTTIVGSICGALACVILCMFVVIGLGCLAQSMTNDASAGSVATVGIITFPLSAVAGAWVGGVTIQKHPRLFCVTLLPLAIVSVATLFLFAIWTA